MTTRKIMSRVWAPLATRATQTHPRAPETGADLRSRHLDPTRWGYSRCGGNPGILTASGVSPTGGSTTLLVIIVAVVLVAVIAGSAGTARRARGGRVRPR